MSAQPIADTAAVKPAQRAVMLVGMLALVVAAYRALMPFSAATNSTGRNHMQCGVAAVEAAHGPSVSNTGFNPSSAAPSGDPFAGSSFNPAARAAGMGASGQGTATTDPLGMFGQGTSYTYFTLSACTAAARHRVTGAGVLAGVAVVGTAGGLLILRQRRSLPAAV